ncbi:DMT family transporter [Pseudemcibacter aquimaris]|uniref:DMT family transporter n=1 Tax=Pseudemcibacter aquimaris TaxID=2857064 RepID=UPI0020122C55|nr:DMT family transporter [Pseudemcibacter aquimaris]MCC3861302.1 DMT family transporter [Pseudemcibacter aquimaris]WDU58076.1 DMT family transporter [Pseudemcibacter aquimaris]
MTLAKSNSLLLFVAAIWGFSFVIQKLAMDLMDPFIYNAFRFLLASLCLLPIRYMRRGNIDIMQSSDKRHMLISTIIAGTIMFVAVAFQQVGIKNTTVSNAGFITGLYIVFVPIIGVFIGHRYKHGIWVAILIACAGLYLLSGMEGLSMKQGDFFILISAVCWALHLIVIDHISHRHHPIAFAIRQFFVCAMLSFIAAIITGERLLITTPTEWFYIAASGMIAIAMGYTIQIYGQKVTPPSQAALIFNTEAVFAAAAGYYFLNEILGPQALIGCVLMLIGTLMAQFFPPLNHRATEQKSLP